MKQYVPDSFHCRIAGNQPVANKMNALIPNEASIGTVACTQSCIGRRVEDLQGGIMAQLFERFSRYIRKLTD